MSSKESDKVSLASIQENLKQLLQLRSSDSKAMKRLEARIFCLENSSPSSSNSTQSRGKKSSPMELESSGRPHKAPRREGTGDVFSPIRTTLCPSMTDFSGSEIPVVGSQSTQRTGEAQPGPDESLGSDDSDATDDAEEVFEGFSGEDEDASLPVIGSDKSPNWSVSQSTFNWFLKVADIDLQDEEISELDEQLLPSEEQAEHFAPPRIPTVLFDQMSASNNEQQVFRTAHKVQAITSTSLKMLLSVLDSLEKEDDNRSKIANAIQLLCSANLRTSRIKRSMVYPSVKFEVKANLKSQPITHTHLFGAEFEEAADTALKAQSSVKKILWKPQAAKKSKPKFSSSSTSQSAPASNKPPINTSSTSHFQSGSSGRSKSFRGSRARGYGQRSSYGNRRSGSNSRRYH